MLYLYFTAWVRFAFYLSHYAIVICTKERLPRKANAQCASLQSFEIEWGSLYLFSILVAISEVFPRL